MVHGAGSGIAFFKRGRGWLPRSGQAAVGAAGGVLKAPPSSRLEGRFLRCGAIARAQDETICKPKMTYKPTLFYESRAQLGKLLVYLIA